MNTSPPEPVVRTQAPEPGEPACTVEDHHGTGPDGTRGGWCVGCCPNCCPGCGEGSK